MYQWDVLLLNGGVFWLCHGSAACCFALLGVWERSEPALKLKKLQHSLCISSDILFLVIVFCLVAHAAAVREMNDRDSLACRKKEQKIDAMGCGMLSMMNIRS